MSDEIKIEGVLFSITFYMVCEHGHVHPVEVKFEAIRPEGLTEGSVRDLMEIVKERTGGWRMATTAEVDKYVMQEQFAEEMEKEQPKGGQNYFMVPGVKEAQ